VYILKEGRIEGQALDDRLSGQWSEAPSYAPPNDAGEFEIHIDSIWQVLPGKVVEARIFRWKGMARPEGMSHLLRASF